MGTKDRAAIVAGGGSGLGRAIARKLGDEGWRVGLLGRRVDQLDESVELIEREGGTARFFSADLLDESSLAKAISAITTWSQGAEEISLIGSAGRFRGIGPLGVVDLGSWWLDIEVTLKGNAQLISAALPLLREVGQASISVLIGPGHNGELANASGYGAAQAGLARLVETLAKELEPERIPVYAVNPGLVPTPLMLHMLDSSEGRTWLPRFTEAFAEGKEVGPEVVSEMIAWLAATHPMELSGRVISAMITPEILSTRLTKIQAQGSGMIRLT